jgi:hypothetical protein
MSRPSKSRLTRWADLVMPHIPSAPSTAISVADLMAKTGLREQEVHHAVGFIRDEMAEIGGRPLVSSGEGYRFTFDEAEVAGFRSTQTRRDCGMACSGRISHRSRPAATRPSRRRNRWAARSKISVRSSP